MRYTTIDRIVRSQLLQAGYSVHWYSQFLKFAADCLRELTFDTLRVINTEKLTVNSYKAVTIPCSYVDFISIGVPFGQYVQPLVASNSINRLPYYAPNGEITTYPDVFQSQENVLGNTGNVPLLNGFGFLSYNWVTWNDYNESLGRTYGLGDFPGANGFKIIPERNIIQLDDQSCASHIILEFISDGQDCNAATRVNSYSQACIEHYIVFAMKKFGRQYSMGEVQEAERRYYNQVKILRGRMNDATISDIKNIIRKNSRSSIKT